MALSVGARKGRPAVFLDKDGTLIDDLPYNANPARITLCEGAGDALQALARRGYALVVVSNQQGIARGWLSDRDLCRARDRIAALLAAHDVRLDGFYWCPHWPWSCKGRLAFACDCRKPAPGMLVRAASEHGLALTASWMVGDILDDIEAGRRAGCRTVLIDNGNEGEWRCNPLRRPHRLAPDLVSAAQMITAIDCAPRSSVIAT